MRLKNYYQQRETEIKFIIKDEQQKGCLFIKNNRKFDLNHLKALKAKKYVEKITV